MYKTLLALIIMTTSSVYAQGVFNGVGFRTQLTAGSTNYSRVPSPAWGCSLMTGDNRSGLIVVSDFDNRRYVQKIESYNTESWVKLNQAPFPVKHLTGDNRYGPIIAGADTKKTSVSYMNSYRANKWINLPDAPFEVQGLAGDNYKGPIIFNGDTLAILEHYAQPEWNVLNHAPFPLGSIVGITGDNHYGVLAHTFSDVAFIDNYSTGVWTVLPSIPMNSGSFPLRPRIIAITGYVNSGVIVQTEHGEYWYMHLSKNSNGSTKFDGRWIQAYNTNFSMQKKELSGDLNNGIAFCHN